MSMNPKNTFQFVSEKLAPFPRTISFIRKTVFVLFIVIVSVSCSHLVGVAGDSAVRELVIDTASTLVRDVAGMHQEIGRLREAVTELHRAVHEIEHLLQTVSPEPEPHGHG